MKNAIESLCREAGGHIGYVLVAEDGSLDIRANEDAVFPSASIIKLTILWTVFREVTEGRLLLTEELPVRAEDIVGGYGVLQKMRLGIVLSIADLCALMIDYSDNVATNMLIDRLSLERIGEEITACDLGATTLRRKMMDVAAKERGLDNYTSPLDVVKLLKLYVHSDLIDGNLRNLMIDILLNQFCNNYIAQYIPSNYKYAHKTGDLPGVFHDVGILYAPAGDIYFLAVMCEEMKDEVAGIRFINNFGQIIFENLK